MHRDITTRNYENISSHSDLSYCETYQPENPYCNVFGPPEIAEVFFIAVFILLGTLGNLMVIFSIVLEKRVNRNGNLFYINLAVADITVSGFFLPTVLMNVVYTENALPMPVCQFAGYIVTVSCTCSVSNMTFIAISRYWYVARNETYKTVFCRRNIAFMVISTWAWSSFIVSPTLFGWSGLIYDNKMAECSWDDQASYLYNAGLITCAIFIPVTVILVFYWRLYVYVTNVGTLFRTKDSTFDKDSISAQYQARLRREMTLLKTLAVTVTLFVLCWFPYGVVVLFFVKSVPPRAKKAVARLGLFNSSINFIIYGIINPVFRQGYKNLILRMTCSENSNRRNLRQIAKAQVKDGKRYKNGVKEVPVSCRTTCITYKKTSHPSPALPINVFSFNKINDTEGDSKKKARVETFPQSKIPQ